MQIQELFQLMSIPLNDTDMVTYTSDDRLASINAGMRALAVVRPDFCSGFVEVSLQPGQCRQVFPDYCEQFLDVCYRTDPNNGIEEPVTLVKRKDWDKVDPAWALEHGLVCEVATDDRLPDYFWVWPTPIDDDQKLMMAVAKPAPYLMVADGDWSFKQKFIQPVIEFALYWLFSRDSTVVANAQRASQHLSAFNSLLGIDTQNIQALSPNVPDYKEA